MRWSYVPTLPTIQGKHETLNTLRPRNVHRSESRSSPTADMSGRKPTDQEAVSGRTQDVRTRSVESVAVHFGLSLLVRQLNRRRFVTKIGTRAESETRKDQLMPLCWVASSQKECELQLDIASPDWSVQTISITTRPRHREHAPRAIPPSNTP